MPHPIQAIYHYNLEKRREYIHANPVVDVLRQWAGNNYGQDLAVRLTGRWLHIITD